MATDPKKNISVKVTPGAKLQDNVSLEVNVFDSKGTFVSTAKLANNTLSLPFTDADLARYRVFVSPVQTGVPARRTKPTIDQLQLMRAYEPALTADTLKAGLTIPAELIKFWWWAKCHVAGKVLTGLNVAPGQPGKPVCHARVHICEVDYWFFWRLPDPIIDRIRWEWWQIVKPTIPYPYKVPQGVVPPIGPDPGPLTKVALPLADLRIKDAILKTAALQAAPQQIFSSSTNLGKTMTGVSSEINSERLMAKLPALTAMPANAEALVSSASLHDVRSALVNNINWFRPYFCYWWRWLRPYFYSSNEIAVVETNATGDFQSDVWYQVFGDKPDIYVWVEYMIAGVWTTVYDPPVPCHTYWDYVCGTPITITLTDPRVPPCNHYEPLPGAFVEVERIGSAAFVQHISQGLPVAIAPAIPQTLTVQGRQLNTVGLTDFGMADNDNRRPFGGVLGLKASFGNDSLITSGITHYRWSYRKVASSTNNHAHSAASDTSLSYLPASDTDWQIISNDVGFLYDEYYTDVHGDLQKTTKSISLLDTSLTGVAFKIPRANINDMVTAAPGTTLAPADQDWMSAYFNTNALAAKPEDAAGLYELKLELMAKSGNAPVLKQIAKNSWKVPMKADHTTTENAPDAFIYNSSATPPPAGLVSGFKMLVRLDNCGVIAAIDNILVDGSAASTDCGFVLYTNLATSHATIGFVASHPNDFAAFSFSITKANGNATKHTAAAAMTIGDTAAYPAVIGDPGAPGYSATAMDMLDAHLQPLHDVQHYQKTITDLTDLLGACPKAAFADVLYVSSLATNGSNDVPLYGSSAVAAFALDHP